MVHMDKWKFNLNKLKILIIVVTIFSISAFAVPVAKQTPNSKPKNVASAKSNNLSLNFQSVDTRTLLQLIAKASGLNFVISDDVKGTMTLHVENIPWQEALNIILKANGLAARQYGEMMLIAPIEQITKNEIMELQAKQQVADLAPLKSEIIKLRYANAKDIAAILGGQNSLLSSRGHVSFDARSNSLWIKDTASNINEVRYFVQKLDFPARQVLIEARVVTVDKSFEKNLGIRWGVTRGNHMSGTLAGANQLVGGGGASSVDVANRLNFNLPAQGLGGLPSASMALALISLGDKTFLDLELSALERDLHAETIASPRVITSNQQPAYIEQGEEIPYQEASSSGATSVSFKKAVLSLKITPQITPDNNIVLDLTVTQDTRGEQLNVTNSSGQVVGSLPPAINTKEVKSNVFLKNGETLVIGGIYQQVQSNQIVRIPFLGRLPFVGALFRNKSTANDRGELLIFVTPTIIDDAARASHAMRNNIDDKVSL